MFTFITIIGDAGQGGNRYGNHRQS